MPIFKEGEDRAWVENEVWTGWETLQVDMNPGGYKASHGLTGSTIAAREYGTPIFVPAGQFPGEVGKAYDVVVVAVSGEKSAYRVFRTDTGFAASVSDIPGWAKYLS